MIPKKRRNYIEVDIDDTVKVYVDDIIEEVDDVDLIDELKRRNLLAEKEYEKPIPKEGTELRKLLCDILDISYHSSDSNILDGIKERLV